MLECPSFHGTVVLVPYRSPVSLSMASVETPWAWIKAARAILQEEPRTQPSRMPVELLPWLFLSNLPAVIKYDNLQALGVTAVLTTNKIVKQEQLWSLTAALAERDIRHGYAGGVDIVGYDMMKYHWDDAKTFLTEALEDPNPKIVIHCAAGTNRSALIAGATMLTLDKENNWTFLQVVRLLKERRGVVLNNVWFIRQLAEFAMQCDKLGTRPGDYTDEPLAASEMVF